MAKGRKKAAKELSPEERLQNALVPKEEWPYELPEGWKWVRLGNIADWTSGGTPSRKHPEYYEHGTIPWIKTGELNDDVIIVSEEQITAEAVANSSAKILPVHTVIVAMYGATIGKTGILGVKASTNQACACAVCNGLIGYKYLFYYIQFIKESLIEQGKGGAQPNISQTIIKSRVMPLPSVTQQEKIVDFIENEFHRLDEAKDKIQSVLDSSEQRKRSILHKAFTDELTETWRRENGHLIDEWRDFKLEACGEWYGGGTPSKSHLEYWDNADILWITSKDMKADTITDTQIKINQQGVNGSSAKLIEKPALLFVMRSGILRHTVPIAMIKMPFSVNQDLKALVVNENILLDYIFYACKEKEREILHTCMKNGTTVESLEFKKLKGVEIKIPSLDEQQEIVRILDEYNDKAKAIDKAAAAVIEKIDEMKKSILAKAFRGELNI